MWNIFSSYVWDLLGIYIFVAYYDLDRQILCRYYTYYDVLWYISMYFLVPIDQFSHEVRSPCRPSLGGQAGNGKPIQVEHLMNIWPEGLSPTSCENMGPFWNRLQSSFISCWLPEVPRVLNVGIIPASSFWGRLCYVFVHRRLDQQHWGWKWKRREHRFIDHPFRYITAFWVSKIWKNIPSQLYRASWEMTI